MRRAAASTSSVGVRGVGRGAGDVDPQPLVAGRGHVERGDQPPACSTAVVSLLTAVPPAGTSSRTVIEYETLGKAVTRVILSRYW